MKIKSERKQTKKESCDLEEQVAQIRDEINKTEAKNKALLANLEDGFKAMKAKEIEIGKLNNEIVTVKSRLDASCIELETMRQNENNNIVEYLCRFCGKKYHEEIKLLDHVRENHFQTVNSQTEDVNFCEASIHTANETNPEEETNEAYHCFYCGSLINSHDDLLLHRSICCEEYVISFSTPSPCYQCSVEYMNKSEL